MWEAAAEERDDGRSIEWDANAAARSSFSAFGHLGELFRSQETQLGVDDKRRCGRFESNQQYQLTRRQIGVEADVVVGLVEEIRRLARAHVRRGDVIRKLTEVTALVNDPESLTLFRRVEPDRAPKILTVGMQLVFPRLDGRRRCPEVSRLRPQRLEHARSEDVREAREAFTLELCSRIHPAPERVGCVDDKGTSIPAATGIGRAYSISRRSIAPRP